MLTTTLNEILKHNPCADGWGVLTGQFTRRKEWVGNDDPITFEEILNSNGLYDALWACRVLTGEDLERFKVFVCDMSSRAWGRRVADMPHHYADVAAMVGDASARTLSSVASSFSAKLIDYAVEGTSGALRCTARATEIEEQIKMFKEFIGC